MRKTKAARSSLNFPDFRDELLPKSRQAFSTLFDGANDSGFRTSTIDFPLDSRKEIKPGERKALIKKSRSLRNNLGLARRLINGTGRYALGRGLIPSAATTDKPFNKKADAYFDRWAMSTRCDVIGRMNFYQMQKCVLREMFTDGEVFALQVKRDDRCQLQLLKTERVGNGAVIPSADYYADGIACDADGAPSKYNVLSYDRKSDQQKSSEYLPEDVIHIFDPERIGQGRGLPWLYHGQNSAVDILDITALEKAAVKLHSYFAAAITTPTGKAPAGVRQKAAAATGGDDSVSADTRQYQNFIGGAAIPVLKKGEEIKFFTSDRPSLSFAGFIDFLVRDIAFGFGVSPEFIWAVAGMGGANTRFILQDAEWFFDEIRQLLIDLFCQRVYSWVIANGILNGELPWCNDPNWHACNWQGPPSLSVDRGRDGKLFIDLVKNGMMSRQDWWSALGKDGLKMRRAIIDELAEDIAYCEEKGVPVGYYIQSMPGQSLMPGAENEERIASLESLIDRLKMEYAELDEAA